MLGEFLSDLRYRLRALFRRSAVERELDDELRFHLEREADKYVAAGLPRVEAVRRAALAFGGLDRTKEESRDARGVALVEGTLRDLRYALRGLRARPAFAIGVVLTLALGIGANAAMFGIVDRLLFRPPPLLRDPARVHRVYLTSTSDGRERTERNFEYTRYADLARWTRTFDRVAAFAPRTLAVGTGEGARELVAQAVSASFFHFFDARPALGRFFSASEDTVPAGAPVAVLAYGYWWGRFGGRPDVLGQQLLIGRVLYTIIGVAPRDFVGIADKVAPVAFVPITAYAAAQRATYYSDYNWGWLEMLVRRRPDVSIEAASADLSAAYRRSWEAERALTPGLPPLSVARPRAAAAPVQIGRGPLADRDTKVVTWVSGVAVVVLLIACANVANLLLARAITRRREIALRLALGVSRGRLLRQLLTESALLAALGGLAGLAAAQWGGATLRALFLPPDVSVAVVTDGRTLLFAAGATVVAALLTGLVPALQAGRGDLVTALRAGAREGTHQRSGARTTLLLFQGAFSVVLLVGAGLFVRSVLNVRALRLGYDVEPVLFVQGNPRGVRLSDDEQTALNARLLAEAQAMPGVERATLTLGVPFWSHESRGLWVPGVDSVRRLGLFSLQVGTPDYFATIGTRILRGRGFTAADREGGPRVAVVSEAMAKALWPGHDAIGKCIRVGADTAPCSTVVGIAENIRSMSIADAGEKHYYLPAAQFEPVYPWLFVRIRGRASDYAETLRRRLQRLMPGAAYVTVMPLRDLVAPTRRAWQFGATMFVAFGALALALAAIGLYSVIAYNVTQRRQELGVRLALGAPRGHVVRLVVGEGIRLVAIGLVVGAVIARAAGRWVEPLLFQVSPGDPTVFALVTLALLGVALAATAVPASRAARVDPSVTLRGD